jgi:hypothetical protein
MFAGLGAGIVITAPSDTCWSPWIGAQPVLASA